MFESYNSCGREGVFYFLGGVLLKTGDTHVHSMYIEAAKVGNLQYAERVTREDEHFPRRVADFLKEVRLPDQRLLINVCDGRPTSRTTSTRAACPSIHVQKVNPMKAR